MTERLLTPSKISAWLGCAHYLTLTSLVEAGAMAVDPSPLSSLAEILVEKGNQHEASCLEDYEAMGKTIYQVPGRNRGEDFLHRRLVRALFGACGLGQPLIGGCKRVHARSFRVAATAESFNAIRHAVLL